MIKDWERLPSPTKQDMERRKNIEKAIADIERVAQGLQPNPNLTKSLAIVLLEVLRESSRASRDLEYTMTGVRAILKAMANDHDDIKDYLSGGGDVHRRGNEPSTKRRR
jgi:hypothetical protein